MPCRPFRRSLPRRAETTGFRRGGLVLQQNVFGLRFGFFFFFFYFYLFFFFFFFFALVPGVRASPVRNGEDSKWNLATHPATRTARA